MAKLTKAQKEAAAKAAAEKKAADNAQVEQLTQDIAAAEAAIATAKEAAAALTDEAEKTKALEEISSKEGYVLELQKSLDILKETLAADTTAEAQAQAELAKPEDPNEAAATGTYTAEQKTRIAQVFAAYPAVNELYLAHDGVNIFKDRQYARLFARESKKPYTTVSRADFATA